LKGANGSDGGSGGGGGGGGGAAGRIRIRSVSAPPSIGVTATITPAHAS
jgi:hypothetical protein